MKRGTTEHPKFLDLCAALQVPKYVAAGVLETLWHFTAKFAFQGDIGRFSDASIARALEWERDPEQLITALVECRWLERHSAHRLIVHDWKDHADQTLSRALSRKSLDFVNTELEDASQKLAIDRQKIDSLKPEARSLKPEAGGGGAKPAPPAAPPAARIRVMPKSDFGQRYDALYSRHPQPGYKNIGQTHYLEILSNALDPELTADAIDRDHAAWCEFWGANPTEKRPGIGFFFEDGYYLRKPKARESTITTHKTKQQEAADAWSRA